MNFKTINIGILLTLLLGSQALFSQDNNNIPPPVPIKQSKFSLGIVGGYGHSFLMPYRNYAFNLSWNTGLSAVYSPWTHWGIGLDAIYSSEGSTITNGDLTYTTLLNYVRVPVKAIYYFNNYEKDFRPKVSFGPTIGILANENNDNNTYNAASFDLGANLSAGFNYRLARAIWLNAELSYYQGFLKVYPENNERELNGNIRVNIGLSFGF